MKAHNCSSTDSTKTNVVMNENEVTSTPAGTSLTTDNLSSIPTDQIDDFQEQDTFSGIDLLHKMDVDDITELRKHFFEADDEGRTDEEGSGTSDGKKLTRDEFIQALEEVAGGMNLSASAGNLFDFLDANLTGYVSWEQVLDGMIEKTEPLLDKMKKCWSPIDPDVRIHRATHCKRESIVKIVALETKRAFCYAVISKLGRVGVYDGGIQLLDSYTLALKPNEVVTREYGTEKHDSRRRSQSTWVADVAFIGDSSGLLFASSDGSLHLYDANNLIHIPICRVIGLHNVPTCLEYYADGGENSPSLLFIGDDRGNIIAMKFHQSKTTLFKKKHPDRLDNYHWSELSEQSDFVTHSVLSGVHKDRVTHITYCPSNKTLLSCSNDPMKALVIGHVDGRRKPYIFKISSGVKCFHYDLSMHLIATGSNDFIVRLWNEVVVKQPIISLYGHKAPIVDLRIIKSLSAVISLSREGIVKVWDIDDYYCLMTLPIQFPILKVAGARIDFGARSLYPGPKTTRELRDDTSASREASRSIGMDDVAHQTSELLLERSREENEWSRGSILVACSNFIAILRLVPLNLTDNIRNELLELEHEVLPPPTREHYASAPSPWKMVEFYTRTPQRSEASNGAELSSDLSSTKIPGSTKNRKKYQIFSSDPVKSPLENMNSKRTHYTIKQEQMKMLVEQCAPHLALDLHELDTIKFSKPLPVTKNMKEKGIDVSDPEKVLKARIQRDPTCPVSLGSSSAAQSPRSSRSSKSTVFKRRCIPSKGRSTPDWFLEKIQSEQPNSTNANNLSQ